MDTATNPSFAGPRLKIKRANQHIAELYTIFEKFLKTDFYKLRVDKQPDTGDYGLTLRQTTETPCEVPLVLGDAIHNLRSALDLTAFEIVTGAGGTPSNRLFFPFAATRDDLVAAMKGGEIKIAGADIVDLIIDTIKPYEGGNDALYSLNKLDVADKHKLIIPLVSVVALTGVDLKLGNGGVFTNFSMSVGQGGILKAVGSGSNIEITKQGKPAFGVFFADGQPFEHQPVFPTLHQLAQLVSGVVDALEKTFLASTQGASHSPAPEKPLH